MAGRQIGRFTSLAVLCGLTIHGCGFSPGEVGYRTDLTSRVTTRGVTVLGERFGPLVQAQVDGQPLWFFLDSGANANVLDRKVARRFDLKRVAGGTLQECGMAFTVGRGTRLEIGQVQIDEPLFVVMDLAGADVFSEVETDVEIAGLLGSPLFEAAVIEFDFGETDAVDISSPADYAWEGTDWVPLHVSNDRSFIEADFAGNGRHWLHVDTGKLAFASFYSSAPDRLGLEFDPAGTMRPNRRLCGSADERVASLPHLAIAEHTFQRRDVAVKPRGSLGDDPIWKESGSIGQQLLRGFHARFDYSRGRLGLTPIGNER